MNTKYQLVFIGEDNTFKNRILDTFFKHIDDLGLNKSSIIVLQESNFKDNYISNSPTVALYFGNDTKVFKNLDILDILIRDASFILPIVNNINNITKLLPTQLHSINGSVLKNENEIEHLVSSILEGLSLLRLSRRLFISYKRNESSGVAIQLYEKLEKSGFDVFLDTHSIRPGEIFQDELWHRLADTDVVVLLNTKGFLESRWTKEELAKANSMSIGIIQLVWPNHSAESMSQLSIQIQLLKDNFVKNKFDDNKCFLEDSASDIIINSVESLRARSLGARQDNLVTEFMKTAKSFNIKADLQPEKFITIARDGGKEFIVLPTVGVPHAFTYNQSEELIKQIRSHKSSELFLLYDHRNIRKKWIEHLSWLDLYLPLKSKKITEIEKWLKTI
ncbi:MAG TPA: toll/interleukin-1 receptor domain-containing protein [Ignavibacteria bacterium]